MPGVLVLCVSPLLPTRGAEVVGAVAAAGLPVCGTEAASVFEVRGEAVIDSTGARSPDERKMLEQPVSVTE
ncbi:MAG: hypothetical protein ACKVQK_16525 [Burkholderiales bacterium]